MEFPVEASDILTSFVRCDSRCPGSERWPERETPSLRLCHQHVAGPSSSTLESLAITPDLQRVS